MQAQGIIIAALAAAALLGPTRLATADELERNLEGSLLHLRVPLDGLTRWDRQRSQWHPMPAPKGKVIVVNLFSSHCRPCLEELPMLARIVQAWASRPAVSFLLVADHAETSSLEIENLWKKPLLELAPGLPCPEGSPRAAGHPESCALTLPDLDPARSSDGRLRQALATNLLPITLLVDSNFVVRQVFSGILTRRSAQLASSIERLLALADKDTGKLHR